MNDIKQALKDRIKELEKELASMQKALAALEGTKPAPKAKAANGAEGTKSGSARSTTAGTAASAPATGQPLPDRILALLNKEDTDSGALDADALASKLGAPLGQVRTTCSRMAREGRLFVNKIGRSTFYGAIKAEPATENPFSEGAN
jgi:cell division septum initiation protein DivIVA